MEKRKHARIRLQRETIRALTKADLTDAAGGNTQLATCSMCPGLMGCSPVAAPQP